MEGRDCLSRGAPLSLTLLAPSAYPRHPMPTRVMFDTHFPGHFLAWPDDPAKAAVLDCIDRSALELWASLEVLEELMGVVTTKQKDHLVPLAGVVLRLVDDRIL